MPAPFWADYHSCPNPPIYPRIRTPTWRSLESNRKWERFGIGFPAERIMIKFRLLGLATLLLVWTAQGRAQFAHAEHKQIVDGAGKPLLVRATHLRICMRRRADRRARTSMTARDIPGYTIVRKSKNI